MSYVIQLTDTDTKQSIKMEVSRLDRDTVRVTMDYLTDQLQSANQEKQKDPDVQK